jgi:hypothetical protein
MTQALRYAAIAAAILCIAIGDTAAARETVRADLRISAPWARASAGKIAEAYVTIKNTGAEPERLLAISSPAAERVELRRYPQLGRVASPQKIKSTEIPPGQTAEGRLDGDPDPDLRARRRGLGVRAGGGRGDAEAAAGPRRQAGAAQEAADAATAAVGLG